MFEEKLVLLLIKDSISNLPPEDQERVQAAAARIRAVMADYPNGAGTMALSLVGAEAAAE